MSNEEIIEVQAEFEADLFKRRQDLFETIYPTLTEEAKHLLQGELK